MSKYSNELVFGVHPIQEVIKAKKRKIYSVYTTKNAAKNLERVLEQLPKYTQIQYVSKEQLNKIAGTDDHQSIIASVSPFITRKKFFDPKKEKFLLMLDSIQDPRNLGAILRTAYCAGVEGVILTSKKSAYLTPTAIKSAAGLSEYLEIFIANSPKEAVTLLKESGYNIFISALQKATNATDTKYELPLCIVIGNEGEGVSKEILPYGQVIKLPQIKADISYNASVAAGILLFQISTQNKII